MLGEWKSVEKITQGNHLPRNLPLCSNPGDLCSNHARGPFIILFLDNFTKRGAYCWNSKVEIFGHIPESEFLVFFSTRNY